MAWDYVEFRIAEHFIFALEYGDYGDMTKEEIAEFQVWLECEQGGVAGHWSIEEHSSEDYGRCAVLGLFANRATVRFNFKTEE